MTNPVDYQYSKHCSVCGLQFQTETELNLHMLSHISQQGHQSQQISCSEFQSQDMYGETHILDKSPLSFSSIEKVHHSIPSSPCGSCQQGRSSSLQQDRSPVSSLFLQDHKSDTYHERYSCQATHPDQSVEEKPTHEKTSPNISFNNNEGHKSSNHIVKGKMPGVGGNYKKASSSSYYNAPTGTEHELKNYRISSKRNSCVVPSSHVHKGRNLSYVDELNGLQKQVHHEFIPDKQVEGEMKMGHHLCLTYGTKVVGTGSKQYNNEVEQNQLHLCMPLEKEVPCADVPEIQAVQECSGNHQDNENQHAHQLQKGNVLLEQHSPQNFQPAMEQLVDKVRVTQQNEKPHKNLKLRNFRKDLLTNTNLLDPQKNELDNNLDTNRKKQLPVYNSTEGNLRSVNSKDQRQKSHLRNSVSLPRRDQKNKEGGEEHNIKVVDDTKRREEDLKTCSAKQSNPNGHLLTTANFIQESIFIPDKPKIKKTRGPYKKMTKVNYDPTSNPEKPYFCDECNKRFKLRDSLRAHQKQGHSEERPWKCEQCGASFKKKGTLTAHYEVHTNIRPHKCESCPATFRRQTELNIHYIKHTNIKPYECDLCGAAFAWKNSLKHHMKTHSSEKPYECEICGASFKWPDSLKLHITTHSSVKEFGCDICNARFKWKRSLRTHKLTHAAVKPFICDLCGSQFVQRAKLKLHMAVHTNDKPFKCECCEMAFARKDRLNAHKKVHSVHKPYKCHLCNSAFRSDYGLKKHFSIHKKAEQLPCSHCGKTFICIREVRKHEKTHTNPITFDCEACNMSFTLKKELNKHNKNTHKIMVKNLRKKKRKRRYVVLESSSEEPEMICIEPRVEDMMEMNERDEGIGEGEEEVVNERDDVGKREIYLENDNHQGDEGGNIAVDKQVSVQNLYTIDVKKEVIEKPQDTEAERHIKEENLTDEDKNHLPV
ncbi:zinc finger protein 676-like [Homarus americanus]|uniref:Zinc finger protein 112-like 1 n=1 Tax=Homarus americanus TaxID=6706 RepID=A0A8J5MZ06_HOMAM|nr:zinc finger protein 676-like [Homarus americanus]KAG7168514.1 Zinc finger protein 112-like 1 [Homarus americanus]